MNSLLEPILVFRGRRKVHPGQFLLLAVIMVLIGCSYEDKMWNDAKVANSKEAYINFIQRYPDGRFSEEARKQLGNHIRSLQIEGFQLITSRDDSAKLEAEQIYSKIRLIDPKNAIALNNLAYIFSTRFYQNRSNNIDENLSNQFFIKMNGPFPSKLTWIKMKRSWGR